MLWFALIIFGQHVSHSERSCCRRCHACMLAFLHPLQFDVCGCVGVRAIVAWAQTGSTSSECRVRFQAGASLESTGGPVSGTRASGRTPGCQGSGTPPCSCSHKKQHSSANGHKGGDTAFFGRGRLFFRSRPGARFFNGRERVFPVALRVCFRSR